MPQVLGYLLMAVVSVVFVLLVSALLSDALGLCSWCGRLDYDDESCRHCSDRKSARSAANGR
jgi:recombinational DNA repair protein RecR